MNEPSPGRVYPPAWRVVVAFITAPAIAALLMATIAPAYSDALPMLERILKTAILYAVFGAYPFTLVLGLPAYLLLRHHIKPTIINCMAVGSAVVVLPALIISMMPSGVTQSSVGGRAIIVDGQRTLYGWQTFAESLLHLAAYGAVGGFVFWLIVAGFRRSADVR